MRGGTDSRTQSVAVKQLRGMYASTGIAASTFSDKVTSL
jgi:hypothetical protein